VLYFFFLGTPSPRFIRRMLPDAQTWCKQEDLRKSPGNIVSRWRPEVFERENPNPEAGDRYFFPGAGAGVAFLVLPSPCSKFSSSDSVQMSSPRSHGFSEYFIVADHGVV